jgi:hypothetical protein
MRQADCLDAAGPDSRERTQLGGQVIWDFSISTFAIDPYSTFSGTKALVLIGLEILALLFLAVGTLAHLNELLHSARAYALVQYLAVPSRWFQAVLLGLMWYGWWVRWVRCYLAGLDVVPDAEYAVLKDPQVLVRVVHDEIYGEKWGYGWRLEE